jgi:outer membrane protein assembly factor BamA
MIRFRLQISVLVFLFSGAASVAQSNYRLQIQPVDKDSAYLYNVLGLPQQFSSRMACMEYVSRLPAQLQSKGYLTVSVDSLHYDSAHAVMRLYVGEPYRWAMLDAAGVDKAVLNAIGWRETIFSGKPMDMAQVQLWQQRLLEYLENNGYPFARVYLDSVQIQNKGVTAQLKVEKGPLYRIDSIRVFGEVKVSNNFLQRYLDIASGSLYSRQKLQRVSRKIRELPYMEEEKPFNLDMLVSGSVLNLYLKQKKSSQANVLLGFLPNNDQLSSKKMLITGEANLLLRNALGGGETFGLNWQQIQVNSPRLNILFRQPYVFRSPVGIDFTFDILRKDTTFVNVNLQLGAQYILNISQWGKIFFQRFQTIVNGINKNLVLQTRRLPPEADVSTYNLGFDYEFNNTDYRFNPTQGNEVRLVTTIGSRKIKKNNAILELKDPGDPSYDFGKLYDTLKLKSYLVRMMATAAKYFPVGRQSTIKTALNGGFFHSGNNFRNELFQIGGYKLLRGFDEESQYLSHYLIATVEYRLLVGQNSFFYALADGGWGRNSSAYSKNNYDYLGTGLGLAFETKAGIFNLAWAIGKRSDTEFSLRQSKIHFGFVSYF